MRKYLRFVVMILVVASVAEQAFAAILPGPFEFQFASGLLNALFLLPFQIAGCAAS
jgi:hypothetical protein